MDVLHRMVESADQHASHWEAECGRLRKQLDAADDLLKRISEWDALNLLPVEAPYGDAPYWQKEIARVRAVLEARAEC